MEALWNLADKWKLTAQAALLLLVCTTVVAVIGICTVTLLKKKAQRKVIVDDDEDKSANGSIRMKCTEPSCNWVSIKRKLMDSMRWSAANRWEERSVESWKERTPPLLGLEEGCEANVGWQSHNSASPVWQRPILMGEKCELPRFSGLILYDERGRSINHSLKATARKDDIHQGKPAAIARTTLKDLL